MPPRPALLARRAPAAALVLALGAAGCGSVGQAQRRTVEAELQSASTALLDSGAVSVRLGLTDPSGTARAALTGEDVPGALADVLLGGSITLTIDPTGTRTLRDLQAMPAGTPSAEVLDAVAVALTVEADGGPVAQLRLVDGDLYGTVDLDRVGSIADAAEAPDVADLVDELSENAPPELAPLVEDVEDGQWVRLPLTPYTDQIDAFTEQMSGAGDDRLAGDLLAAVRPFVQVTDAGGDAGERVLDVQVQARKALEALLTSVGQLAGPGDPLPEDALEGLGDGTASGRVVLQDGHLESFVLDLGSVARLDTGPDVPDLSGSTLTVTVDDSAAEVVAPTPVSDERLGDLVDGLLEDLSAPAYDPDLEPASA